MSANYQLAKWVFTEEDYEQMGWHDCKVRALTFHNENYEFILDIDYILQWLKPAEGETFYNFLVSPATPVFENVYDLEFDLQTSTFLGIEIDELKRETPRRPRNADHIKQKQEWKWTLDCHEGDISFWSVGFKQYIRAEPKLVTVQQLDLVTRGGISFDRRRNTKLQEAK